MKTITTYIAIALNTLTIGNALPTTEDATAAALARRCQTESFGGNGGTTMTTGDCSGDTFSGTNVVNMDSANSTATNMPVKRGFPWTVHPPECQSIFEGWDNSCSLSCLGQLPNVVSCSKDVFDMNCLCQDSEVQELDRSLEYCTWRACGHPSIAWMSKICASCNQARQKEQADRQKEIALEGGGGSYPYNGRIVQF